jgi:hypothetical protein
VAFIAGAVVSWYFPLDCAPSHLLSHQVMQILSSWRGLLVPLAWVLGLGLCVLGTRGPFDPASHRFGVNWPGDLRRAVIQLSVETFVLLVLLRPWSYRASWGRALIAFALFAGWTVLGGLGGLHAGHIDNMHWGWLLLVTFGLFVAFAVSVVAAIRARPAYH